MWRRMVSSLRLRLLLLVLLAVLPALGLAFYTHAEESRLVRARAQDEARRLVQLAVLDQERVIEGTRQMLIALSELPEIQQANPATCSPFLANLYSQYEGYSNFGRTNLNGDLICSATPTDGPVFLGDRPWHHRVLETHTFARGEYQVGRVTGLPNLVSGYPVLNEAGEAQGVVYAGLKLAWLNELVSATDLPPDTTITIHDSSGTILARFPESAGWVGRGVPDAPIVQTVLAQHEGTAELPGEDGVTRLYAFAPLGRAGAPEYVSVGLSPETWAAEARARLARNVAGVLAAGLLALIAAWIGGEAFVLRPVKALAGAADRLRAGDLSARAGLAQAPDELGRLAGTFDAMAEALQHREAQLVEANTELERRVAERTAALRQANEQLEVELTERRRAQQELARLSHQNQLILDAAGEGIYGVDREGRTIFVNPSAARMLGYSVEELVGQPMPDVTPAAPTNGNGSAAAGTPLHRVLAEGMARHELDAVFWRRDGTSFPVEYVSTPLREGAEILGAVITFKDVSERKRVEAAQREAQQMEGRLEGVTLAAREVAHLVNNALTMPIAVIDLLSTRGDLTPLMQDMVQKAADGLTEAETYVKRLQRVVRVETKDTIVGPALDLERSVQPN